ncbi:MAG TPA: hypothetical protein VGB30_09825, partial [bacterium]
MFIVIAICIVIFAVMLGFAFSGNKGDSESFEERLKAMARDPEHVDLTALELSKPFSERVLGPIFERIGRIVTKITPSEVLKDANRKCQQSGLKINPATFVAAQIALAVALPGLMA